MPITFFDLDRTLLAQNSASLWLRLEVRAGRVRTWDAVRAGMWLLRYQLGRADMDEPLLRAIESLKGSSSAQLRDRTEAFFHEHVRRLYRPGGRAAIEEHRRRGDQLVLLTSSSNYLSALVAKDLGLDATLCNELEVDADGLHTGRAGMPLCFAKGKLARARTYAAAQNVSLESCAFYTDSYSDLAVLEAVGAPVAVNPDRPLRREALRRAWPIVDWGDPPAKN